MSNVTKTEFPVLDITGRNYMAWTSHVKRHLKSMGVLATLEEGNECPEQDKAKADVFLHKHIDEMLEFEYSDFDDPSILWKHLKSRFDLQRDVLLPTARDEWNNLRFQDFKRVNEYTSALFRICSTLRFCGQTVTEEDMLEKTYSTFHASNINLQQQYRLQKFKRYSDLNSFLLVAEKNNELLMKNHQSRPVGSVAFPEANATHNVSPHNVSPKNNIRGRGRGRGRGQSRFGPNHSPGYNHTYGRNHNFGRGHPYGRGRGRGRGRNQRTNTYHAPQGNKAQPQNKVTKHDAEASASQNTQGSCYRCGSTDHWQNACRIPSHLCKLYQASLKKGEVNFVDQLDYENTELNTSDFLNEVE